MKYKVLLAVFLLFTTGCSLFFSPLESPKHQGDSNTHEISLYIDGLEDYVSQRTLVPNLPSNIEYRISFNGPTSKDDIVVSSSTPVISLSTGTWEITIDAIDINTTLTFASGTGQINVPDETGLNVSLSTNTNGTDYGSLDITLECSAGSGITITGVTAKLVDIIDSSEIPLSITGSSSPYRIVKDNIASGYYLLLIEFTDSLGNTMNPYSDLLHIYSNLETSATITRDSNSFTSLPQAPSSLSLMDGPSGVKLTWTDNAKVETGFRIERRESGGSFAELRTLTGYNLEEFVDTTAVDGTGYDYRVMAINAFGSSAPSNIQSVTLQSTLRIIHVTPGGQGNQSGDSWANAMADLQQAIDLSYTYTRRAEVWVAAGTYLPQTSANNSGSTQRDYHFSLRQGVAVYGGFSGNELHRYERDSSANKTILSGDFNQDDVISGQGSDLSIINVSDNAYHVFYHRSSQLRLDHNAVLDGFTITGSWASSGFQNGGAIYNYYNSPRISNCVFTGNIGRRTGGALYFERSSILIENCVFDRNRSEYNEGGGLSTKDSNGLIQNCVFFGNRADDNGAAYSSFSDDILVIQNCTIFNNYSVGQDSIYSDGSSLTVANSIVSGSEKSIFLESTTIRESFYSSVFPGFPNSINRSLNSNSSSDIYALEPEFRNSTSPAGPDNIWMTEDDGLVLTGDNLGVNGGTNLYMPEDIHDVDMDGDIQEKYPIDILGNDRIRNGIIDLGAYEISALNTNGPAPVSDIQVQSFNGTITLEWKNPSSADLSQIEISWSPQHGEVQPKLVNCREKSAVISGLTNNIEYNINITALDNVGNRSTTIAINTTPVTADVPDVENLQVVAVNQASWLSWIDPTAMEFHHIEVNISPNPGITLPIIVQPGTEELFIDGLTNGTNYTVDLKTSGFSSQLSTGITQNSIPSEVIRVDQNASGSNNGSTWTDALRNLSDAIHYSQPGNQIWVAQGVYFPTRAPHYSEADDPRENHFTVKNGVSLLGGFAGTESSLSQRDYANNVTILSGDLNSDDLVLGSGENLRIINQSDNLFHIMVFFAESRPPEAAIVDGFTLSGGNAGPGAYAIWSTDAYDGPAVYSRLQRVSIRNSIITNNYARYGGALHSNSGIFEIANCVFYQNYSGGTGGAVEISYGSANITGSLFVENHAEDGGALYMRDAVCTIYNSSFINNYAQVEGGAIYRSSSYIINMYNSILWNNRAAGNGNSFYNRRSEFRGSNNLIEDFPSSAFCEESDQFRYVYFTDTGNPLFKDHANPIGPDQIWLTADDGFGLQDLSPAIDLGNQFPKDGSDIDFDGDTTENLPFDLAGFSRFSGNTIDAGPYESPNADQRAPREVSSLEAVNYGASIELSWVDPIDSDFDQVQITWTPKEGPPDNLRTVFPGTETFSINGLSGNWTYTFSVVTVDSYGNASSGINIDCTLQDIPPQNISNLTINEGFDEAQLSWQEPANYLFKTVEIDYTPQGGITETLNVTPGTSVATLPGLALNTEYSIQVRTQTFANEYSTGVSSNFITKNSFNSLNDSFEASTIPDNFYGDWQLNSNTSSHGFQSLGSNPISDNEAAILQTWVSLTETSTIEFDYSTSSQQNSDFLQFYVDGIRQNQWSGNTPWTRAQYNISPGQHKLEWIYHKNSSGTGYNDRVFIDNIIIYNSSQSLIELNLDLLTDETITLNQNHGFVSGHTERFNLSITQSFDSYSWYLDNSATGDTTQSIEVDCALLSPGMHYLMCVVGKNGHFYSKTIYFEIQN